MIGLKRNKRIFGDRKPFVFPSLNLLFRVRHNVSPSQGVGHNARKCLKVNTLFHRQNNTFSHRISFKKQNEKGRGPLCTLLPPWLISAQNQNSIGRTANFDEGKVQNLE